MSDEGFLNILLIILFEFFFRLCFVYYLFNIGCFIVQLSNTAYEVLNLSCIIFSELVHFYICCLNINIAVKRLTL